MEEARTRARIATLAVVGTFGAVALMASRPDSPMTPELWPGARAPGWMAWLAGLLGLDGLSRDVAGLVGAIFLVASAAAFVYALREAWQGRLTVRRVLAVGVGLHVLALLVPLFLSRDVYSYTFYGRMVSVYGANPYTELPLHFPLDPAYALVSTFWIDSPAVYGPAFTTISAWVTGVVRSPEGTVHAFKLLAAVSSAATMFLAVAAARRLRPQRAAFAAALIGWNPVVIFHGVAGGHNDTLVGLALAVAVLLVLSGRDLWATAVLTVGALVKISGGVPLAVVVLASVLRRPPGRRLRTFAAHALVGLAVGLPFILPYLQTQDPTLGTFELAGRQGWLAPSRLVLVVIRGIANHTLGTGVGSVVAVVVRSAFPVIFLLVLVGLARHLWRHGPALRPDVVVGAMGWAVLVSLLISPILLPWYAAWVVPLAWVLPRQARTGTVVVAVALTITELVAEPSRAPRVWEVMVIGLHWVATPIALLVLIRLLLDLRRRLAIGPGEGWEDPLLAEMAGGERVPALAGAGRESVTDARGRGHREQGDAPAGARSGDVDDHGDQDRHGHPD